MTDDPLWDDFYSFNAKLNAAANLVTAIKGKHVLYSKRYNIAAQILRIIDEAFADDT